MSFFFGLGFPPWALIRASAAAARSALILALSSGVRFSSKVGAGVSSRSMFVVPGELFIYLGSAPVPNRWPCWYKKERKGK